jgi:hypothetical protein
MMPIYTLVATIYTSQLQTNNPMYKLAEYAADLQIGITTKAYNLYIGRKWCQSMNCS